MTGIKHISAGKILLVLCLFFAWQNTFSQDIDVQSFSSLKKSADGAIKANDVHLAIGFLAQMLELKPDHLKTNLKLANLSFQVRDFGKALECYNQYLELEPAKTPEVFFKKSLTLKNLGRYEESKTAFEAFISKYRKVQELKPLRKQAEAAVLSCDSALASFEKQLNVDISRLPDLINGPHIEFNPFYLKSDVLVYGKLPETEVKKYSTDSLVPVRGFYSARKNNEEWEDLGEWNPQVHSDLENTGNGCFNADSTQFYFSKCAEDWTGKINCKIYKADFVNGQIQEPILLNGTINQEGSSNSQPAIGYETKMGRMVLYFVSDREGGRGGKDIWASQYDSRKKKFKTAKNLGRKINSEENEITPYYDEVRRKLYYSSNKISGFGGYDVYEVRGENRTWGIPQNVGYPINTHADELYFKVNQTGEEGLFTSNRSGSSQMFHPTCCDDIYEFKFRDYVILVLEGSIVEINEDEYIQGKGDGISDIKEFEKIDRADISVFLIEDGEEVLIKEMQTSRIGDYTLQLEEGADYRIEVSKPLYFTNFLEVSTKERTFSDTLNVNVGIAKLGSDALVIPNIYYDFDSAELRPESKDSLRQTIYEVLIENPKFKIEIGSHTDSRGTEDYNERLSQERAESVVKYLISLGISKSRLVAKGYGESQPVAPNENEDGSDNPEGRQLNRRTEFRILELNSGSF